MESGAAADEAAASPADEAGLRPGELRLDCPLVKVPSTGVIKVTVVDQDGKPVADADLRFEGTQTKNATTGDDGKSMQELQKDTYTLTVEKDGYFKKVKTVSAQPDTVSDIEIQLNKQSKQSFVVVKQKKIIIKKQIHFATNSDEIKSESFALMDEIAYVMESHPELTKVEIQGHTDNRGTLDYNMSLSERRASSVRQYLVDSGIDGARLDAKGYGPTRAIAPNITGQGRARNRRVEFHIIDRQE